MEQSKSYQLYKLEGEQQKAEFEYQNAYRANQSVLRKMDDVKYYLRMSIMYMCLIILFVMGAEFIFSITGDGILARIIIPFIYIAVLISLILWLGIIWKFIKYGFSYGKVRRKKEQTENDLISAGQRLNSIQIKMENLQKEIESEEEAVELDPIEVQETLVRKIRTLEYKINRLKRNYDETESEFHVLLKEEFENEQDKKRYARLTIAGVILLFILAVIQSFDIMAYYTIAARVIILLMPWCIIMPYSIGWLSKAMNTFWGEELWINRFVFKEIHDYSIAGRIRKSQENMKQIKEEIAVLEKEKQKLVTKQHLLE